METRRHLPRAALSRMYFIDRQIASGKFPNVNDLAKEYEVGTATIYRDIEWMRDRLRAPIEYDAKNRGWYYTIKTFRLPARFAAANDMLALGMAKSLLQLYHDTPLYESAKRLLDEITAPLTQNDTEDSKKAAWFENRIIVPFVPSAPVDPKLWELVLISLKENRVITFGYNGLLEEITKSPKMRLVRPYQLLFDTGVWYLYGYSEERSAIRMFSLSRMTNAALKNETFSLPADFKYCTNNGDSYFGVFAGEKQHYRIQFFDAGIKYIEERKWASDQKIEKQANGSIILDFTSTQSVNVARWVHSFGGNAFPIEPVDLLDGWAYNVRRMYDLLLEEEENEK